MGTISYLTSDDLNKYDGLSELSSLNSKEDVATLIEVFEDARNSVNFTRFSSVVQDEEKYYYMVTDGEGSFDLLKFVNDSYDSDVQITSVNIGLLFPRELSRGIYDDTASGDDEDDGEEATSFLDEDEMLSLTLKLKHRGNTIAIPNEGLIIGRSVKRVDYVVPNNNVGRVHCKIYRDAEGKLMIHDFDSLNGTLVNNVKVHEGKDIHISLGDTILVAGEEFSVISGD